MTSSEPIAPKISTPTTKRKIHSIQERSQKRISNRATPQSMSSTPRTDFAEENIFQIGRTGSKSLAEGRGVINVKKRTSADEPAGDHLVTLLVTGQFGFGNGNLPHSAIQLSDGILRTPLIQHSAVVDNRRVGAQVGHVVHDVRGKNHDHLLANLSQEIVKTVPFSRV